MKKGYGLAPEQISTVVTAFIFMAAGAIPIFIAMCVSAELQTKATVSLIMCGSVVSSIMTIFLAFRYKVPLYVAPSITAVVVMGPLLKEYSLPEMVFGLFVAGAVLFLLGAFKLVGKIAKYIPIPIVLAMVAGVYMNYGVSLVLSVVETSVAGILVVGAYFGTACFFKKLPPQAAALAMAALVTVFFMPEQAGVNATVASWTGPMFLLPEFRLDVLVYVSLPLIIMAISDVFKGYGVLKANGFDIPLDEVTMFCGISSMAGSFGLGHINSLAGPAVAILAGESAGDRSRRYVGAIIFSGMSAVFALAAGIVIGLLDILPKQMIDIICGLAMIGLLSSALSNAFGSKKFQLGALAAFLVGLSHITIMGIGAPVWALIAGLAVSFLVERTDFDQSVS